LFINEGFLLEEHEGINHNIWKTHIAAFNPEKNITESQENLGWRRPQDASSPTSCSKQG